MSKEIWLSVGPETTVSTLQKGFHLNYNRVWCPVDHLPLLQGLSLPQRISLVVQVDSAEALDAVANQTELMTRVSALCVNQPTLIWWPPAGS